MGSSKITPPQPVAPNSWRRLSTNTHSAITVLTTHSSITSCLPATKVKLLHAYLGFVRKAPDTFLGLTDKVAQESKDSTASTHENHKESQTKATAEDHSAAPVSWPKIKRMLEGLH